ncbi:General stress protein 26 [Catalinimonas alkaloidigena]|uniref:General stress protein 26 n=1 Tax=Catalinimonas alkaloidigena TaxID=1075417 RepID=A0A1G9NE78_9BACT|nr:pyridoxamine 5'-phosphate oxidase family protein [Catalinimonas alkaloidigena]SDL84427.1 General stress protein 26 [Catalinimonas alkaloidigena]
MEGQITHTDAAIKLKEEIEKVEIAMLTTQGDDGRFRARPMHTTRVDADGILWFFTSDQSDKVREIERNPKVGLGYSGPGKDTYVSVSGEAQLVKDKAKMHDLWNPTLKAWFADGLDTPDIALLKITVEKAEYWDSASGTLLTLYGMVKSTVTGKDARGDSEHEKLDVRS